VKFAALRVSFRRVKRLFASSRIGTSTQPYGALATWLITLINIVSGNFDRAGGYMFTSPAVDLVDPRFGTKPGGFDRWRSRVRDLPEFSGELPVSTMAETRIDELCGNAAFSGLPVTVESTI
jgi:hypothetical protein